MLGDTSLMRMVIENLAVKNNWTYDETLEKFYYSDTCKGISNRDTGMFTFAPIEIIELYEEEIGAAQ